MNTVISADAAAATSPLIKARLAALAYIITFVAGGMAMSARGSSGIALNLIADVAYLAVTYLFYEIFKPVSPTISLAAALFSLAGIVGGVLSVMKVISLPVNTLVFFGAYCVLIGILIARSTFLPPFLGALMLFAGFGWLTFLLPRLAAALSPYVLFPGILGEGTLTLWLLIAGLNVERWHQQAAAVE